MKYEWFIGLRYLMSRRKQTFISIISVISVGCVALGIATVIVAIAVMNGFEDMIKEKARANNLNEEKIIFIARCESQIEPDALGDSHLICAKTQKPVRSRGVWQINNCAHPEISDEQAFDLEWSTNWAMEIFKKGEETKEWRRCASKYIKNHLATNH